MRLPSVVRKKRAVVIAVLVLALVGGLTQAAFWGWVRCHPLSEEEMGRAGVEILTPAKEKSFEKWKGHRIGTEKVTDYCLERTGLVLCCDLPLRITPDESRAVPDPGDPDRPPVGGGTATPVSEDGYWLTASHVLSKEYVYLATYERGGGPTDPLAAQSLHRIRVVWKGARDDPKLPDLALIRCSLPADRYFSLDDSVTFSPGTEVLAAGFGNGLPGRSSGEIGLIGPDKAPKNGARWKACLSDAPLVPGDSGGPLFTAGGQLIGINVSGHYGIRRYLFGPKQIVNYRARTICPDREWIRELIERDREEFGEGDEEKLVE